MPWHLLWTGGSKQRSGAAGPPVSTCSCGGCGGLHPVTQNISRVLSVHPTLNASLSRGPRSPVAPVADGGQCGLRPVLHQFCNQALALSKPHTCPVKVLHQNIPPQSYLLVTFALCCLAITTPQLNHFHN